MANTSVGDTRVSIFVTAVHAKFVGVLQIWLKSHLLGEKCHFGVRGLFCAKITKLGPGFENDFFTTT